MNFLKYSSLKKKKWIEFKNFFFLNFKSLEKLLELYNVENFDRKDRINYLKKKKEFEFAQMFEERFKFPETVWRKSDRSQYCTCSPTRSAINLDNCSQ